MADNMTERVQCTHCGQKVAPNAAGAPRRHGPRAKPCPGGARPRPKSLEEKAFRYVEEGRVKVISIDRENGMALVEVQGSKEDPYRVRYAGGVWTDNCDAKQWRCSHVVAAGLVIDMSPVRKLYKPDPSLEFLKELIGTRTEQRDSNRYGVIA